MMHYWFISGPIGVGETTTEVWPAVLASSALEWWILLPVTEGRWVTTGMVETWRKIPSRVHPSQAGVRSRICVCVGLCQSWLQAGANGYPREYDWDKIPGWNTGNASGTTHRRASLGSSSIIHAWRSVDAYCQSLSGIPQQCRHRCHAVAEYEPRPQHYWTFVGPHHQRTEPDGKPTSKCCRTSECHSIIWQGITLARIRRLVRSGRRRCEAVIAARGGNTCYWFCSVIAFIVQFIQSLFVLFC